MYYFYLGAMQLPVAPEKLTVKIKNNNETVNLINDSEVNLLKSPGLTEFEFDALLPSSEYPFASYKNGFQPPNSFLRELSRLKAEKVAFQFVVTRELPDGKYLFKTNIKCSLESFTLSEDAKNGGFDVLASIKLKQYRDFGLKTCRVIDDTIIEEDKREEANSPAPKPTDKNETTYTVVRGDCLWAIAKRFYGDGSKYAAISEANKDKITVQKLITPGMVLKIPALAY
ncbi:MAG: LysM peptidoglycan-binding domain-containing protein [Oscillospiraceae bacterium]